MESLFPSWIPCLFFSKWITLISFDVQEFGLIFFILTEKREEKSKKKRKRKNKREKKPNRMASQNKVSLCFTRVGKTLLISLSNPWVSVLLPQKSAQSIWDEPYATISFMGQTKLTPLWSIFLAFSGFYDNSFKSKCLWDWNCSYCFQCTAQYIKLYVHHFLPVFLLFFFFFFFPPTLLCLLLGFLFNALGKAYAFIRSR